MANVIIPKFAPPAKGIAYFGSQFDTREPIKDYMTKEAGKGMRRADGLGKVNLGISTYLRPHVSSGESSGDSLVVMIDRNNLIACVLDEAGKTGLASAVAANALIDFFSKYGDTQDRKTLLTDAMEEMGEALRIARISGTTTATLVLIENNMRYHAVFAGDSDCYHHSKVNGLIQKLNTSHELTLPLPIGIYKDLKRRLQNGISAGKVPTQETMEYTRGRLNVGDSLVLCSDGVSKNTLFLMESVDGKIDQVLQTMDMHDINQLVENLPKNTPLAWHIGDVIASRMSKKEPSVVGGNGSEKLCLIPSRDDVSIIAIQY